MERWERRGSIGLLQLDTHERGAWSLALVPTATGTIQEDRAMLVLSRHRDEEIVIGHDIVITVVEIRGDKVRLGIDAPALVSVHRREVYDAIQRDGQKRGGAPLEQTPIDQLQSSPDTEQANGIQ